MPSFATDPGAQVTPMSLAEMAAGLNCGALSIGQLNYLFQIALANAGPDVYLSGLQSYNPTTNTLVLLLTDGSTVNVDMTQLVADAVASVGDAADGVRGLVNNVSLQELGGADKAINSVRIGRGGSNDSFSVALGLGAASGTTGVACVHVGWSAGSTNSGNGSTFVGALSGSTNTGSDAVGVGRGTAASNTGFDCSFVGATAGQSNSGHYSSAIGWAAANGNIGAYFCGIGYAAGINNTGADVVALGRSAAAINAFNNVVSLGAASVPTADNQVMLGGPTYTEVRTAGTYYGAGFVTVSDGRNKDDQRELDINAAIALQKGLRVKEYDLMTSWASIEIQEKNTALCLEAAKRNKQREEDRYAAEMIAYNEALKAVGEQNSKALAASMSEPKKRKSKNDFSPEPALQVPDKPMAPNIADFEQYLKQLENAPTLERKLIAHQAGVIAQELRELTDKIGAFGWLVKEDAKGELAVDYQSLAMILSAATAARLEAAGL